jgi:hypothetical protein
MNASFNASNIDLYMSPIGADITAAAAVPTVIATAYKTSGPATGGESIDIPGGTYKVTITTAGTKAILFQGKLVFGNNSDILLVSKDLLCHRYAIAQMARSARARMHHVLAVIPEIRGRPKPSEKKPMKDRTGGLFIRNSDSKPKG